MKSITIVAAGLAMALASGAVWAQANPEMAEPPTCDSGGQRFVFKSGEEPHLTRITLCGNKGATSVDLVKMFDSAVTALSKNTKLAPDKRLDLIAQIRLKAEEFRPAGSAVPPAPALMMAPAITTAPAIAGTAPPKSTGPVERPPEYTSLPPLPPPLPAGATTVATASGTSAVSTKGAASPPIPRLRGPRLTIECVNLEDLGGAGDCSLIERQTQVVVRAEEAVPAQTSLRFVRRGDTRAEVELAQLSRGKAMQLALPDEVCAGVNNSRLEIQVVRRAGTNSAGQVVDTLGPYLLHC
jgi:hypothetical protein